MVGWSISLESPTRDAENWLDDAKIIDMWDFHCCKSNFPMYDANNFAQNGGTFGELVPKTLYKIIYITSLATQI